VFVVTHSVPAGWPREDLPFTFVTDGVERAVAQARAAAGAGRVGVAGPTGGTHRHRGHRRHPSHLPRSAAGPVAAFHSFSTARQGVAFHARTVDRDAREPLPRPVGQGASSEEVAAAAAPALGGCQLPCRHTDVVWARDPRRVAPLGERHAAVGHDGRRACGLSGQQAAQAIDKLPRRGDANSTVLSIASSTGGIMRRCLTLLWHSRQP
jgi:hypothetical protein